MGDGSFAFPQNKSFCISNKGDYNNPRLSVNLRTTRMNTNKNNKMHWFLSGWKCFSRFVNYFDDFFRIHSRDSWFNAL